MAGFLGLKGTGFGNFVTDIWEGAGDVLDDAGDIIASAPNQVRNFSDQLADIIYGGARQASQQAQNSEFAQDLQREGQQFYGRQAGDRVGQTVTSWLQNPNAPIFILVALGIIVAIIAKD